MTLQTCQKHILVSYSIKKYLRKQNKQTLITQSIIFNLPFSDQTSNQLRLMSLNRTCSQQLLAPYKRLIDNSSKTNYKRMD